MLKLPKNIDWIEMGELSKLFSVSWHPESKYRELQDFPSERNLTKTLQRMQCTSFLICVLNGGSSGPSHFLSRKQQQE